MKRKIGKAIDSLRKKLLSLRGRPPRIAIELTNRCNLNCPFCLVGMQNELESVSHDKLPRPFGMMDISLGEKILKDAKDFGIMEIMLTFQGEPLLHKGFVEFVRLCRKHGMKPVLFTNGLLFTPELARESIRAGLASLRFSVDGASQETYGKNRVGGNFEKVFKNMSEMARIAKEENSPIKLAWQYIALRNNEHEIPRAEELAKSIGIPLIVKTFAESVPELAPLNPAYRRSVQYKPCKDIYRCPAILWTGEVVPCCYDVAGKEIMGDMKKDSLATIWNSPKYRDFRKRVDEAVSNPGREPQLCIDCLKWNMPEKK